MSKKIIFLLAVCTLVSIILSACGGPVATPEIVVVMEEPVAEEPNVAPAAEAVDTSGGTLSIGIGAEPETLDPGNASYVQEQLILTSLFDSLLSIAPDNSIQPGLARWWRANDANTRFTFTLRDDVTFHDGTPLNAQAVKATFDHIWSDEVQESAAKSLLESHNYLETEIMDDYNVVIQFGSPYPTFLWDAARQWFGISSPHALAQYGGDYGRQPVGSGPFMLASWEPGSQIVLVRNPGYNWGPVYAAHQGPAYLYQLIFLIMPNAKHRLEAFQVNEIQVASEPPAAEAIELDQNNQGVLESFAQPGVPGILMINTAKAPTDDLNVRKAMILAIDQTELAKNAFQSLGFPTYSVLSPNTWAYNAQAASLYRFNLEEAGRLLDASGWSDRNADGIREKNGINLALDYVTNPVWESAFNELVAGYLQRAGFQVTVRPMDDVGVYNEAVIRNYNLLYMYRVKADPSPLRDLFHSDNIADGPAWTRYFNPELDRVLEDGELQTDENARQQDYLLAQSIIMENALVIPLFTINSVYLVSPDLEGFSFDIEGIPWLYEVSLSE